MTAKRPSNWRLAVLGVGTSALLVWACGQLWLMQERPCDQPLGLLPRGGAARDARDAEAVASLRQEVVDLRRRAEAAEASAMVLRREDAELRARLEASLPAAAPSALSLAASQPQPGAVGGVLSAGPPARLTEAHMRDAASRDAIAVVVISCKRPKYLSRAMESVFRTQRDPARFPLIISQDGDDAQMAQMVEAKYASAGVAFHMRHEHEASAEQLARRSGRTKSSLGYVRIAQHFGYALRRVFDELGFGQAILLEEDLEVSPDFFSYFGAMLPMLRSDPDLFCVSAWNDNGYDRLVADSRESYRTDFFPGLGWMIDRNMWAEVHDRWPSAYWDEFMRRPDVRKGRHCIRPEVSRSFTFGEEGTSEGQFFKAHLSKIKLNNDSVDWAAEDLTRFASAAAFDLHLSEGLKAARHVELSQVDDFHGAGEALRVVYDDKTEYMLFAKKFGLMEDEKEGIRRMSYRGVIPFAWQGRRIYLYTRSWPVGLS